MDERAREAGGASVVGAEGFALAPAVGHGWSDAVAWLWRATSFSALTESRAIWAGVYGCSSETPLCLAVASSTNWCASRRFSAGVCWTSWKLGGGVEAVDTTIGAMSR